MIKVTEADREAATETCLALLQIMPGDRLDLFREALTRSFARHREESQAELIEALLPFAKLANTDTVRNVRYLSLGNGCTMCLIGSALFTHARDLINRLAPDKNI